MTEEYVSIIKAKIYHDSFHQHRLRSKDNDDQIFLHTSRSRSNVLFYSLLYNCIFGNDLINSFKNAEANFLKSYCSRSLDLYRLWAWDMYWWWVMLQMGLWRWFRVWGSYRIWKVREVLEFLLQSMWGSMWKNLFLLLFLSSYVVIAIRSYS